MEKVFSSQPQIMCSIFQSKKKGL